MFVELLEAATVKGKACGKGRIVAEMETRKGIVHAPCGVALWRYVERLHGTGCAHLRFLRVHGLAGDSGAGISP